jgi:ERCC4-type nuclease
VIDIREQRPYRFARSTVAWLPTGDYSLQGHEDRIAIERKTKTDAYSSLGHNRTRFQREWERLAQMDYAAVVIESTLPGFLSPPLFSRLNPSSAICTLLAWSVRYGVHVFFAGDRKHGNNVTRQLLNKYYLYHGGNGCG